MDLTQMTSCDDTILKRLQQTYQWTRTRNGDLKLVPPDIFVLPLLKFTTIAEGGTFYPPESRCPALFGNLEEAISSFNIKASKEALPTLVKREVGEYRLIDVIGSFVNDKGTLTQAVNDSLAQNRTKLLINLAGMTYLDSSFMGQILGNYQRFSRTEEKKRQIGLFWLLNPTEKIHLLFSTIK